MSDLTNGVIYRDSKTIGNVPDNPALRAYQEAYNSTNDPYIRSQLENALAQYQSQEFAPNFLQNIAESLGDHSASVNFENQRSAELMQFIEGLMEGKHTEDYTNPAAEVARRKAAGLNDDLNGGSQIGSGEPAKIDEPNIKSGVVNDGSNVIEAVGNIGAQIVSFAMQAYQGFQQIRALDLENLSREFNISESSRGLAWNIIKEGVSEYIGKNPELSADDLADPSLVVLAPSLLESFGSRVNSLPISHRSRKRLSNLVDNLVYTYDNRGFKTPSAEYQKLVLDQLSSLHKSRHGYVESRSELGSETSDFYALDVIAEDIYKPINELIPKVSKSLQNLNLSSQNFHKKYYDKASELGVPEITASADFASAKVKSEFDTIRSQVTSTFNEMNKKIDNNKFLPHPLKFALKTGIAVSEANFLSHVLSGTLGSEIRNDALTAFTLGRL